MSRPNPRILVPLLLVVVLAAVAGVLWSRRGGGGDPLEASGTVEATEAQLGFQAAGRIDSLFADEGSVVRAGRRLATLDRVEARARRAQAAAALATAGAALDELQRGSRPEEVAQARAARDAAAQRRDEARRDLDRMRELSRDSLVSAQALEKAQTALDVAQSQLQQAEEQYRLVVKGPRLERIAAQRAQVAQAAAALEAADAALANMEIRAPFDGVVTVKHREPGEALTAGSPVFSLLDPNDRWVRIYVSEARIGAVRLGQRAAITSDTFRGRVHEGRVVTIASQAEFTPKNVQTREERVKLVYAVRVRITGDPQQELKPGMPADVRLLNGER